MTFRTMPLRYLQFTILLIPMVLVSAADPALCQLGVKPKTIPIHPYITTVAELKQFSNVNPESVEVTSDGGFLIAGVHQVFRVEPGGKPERVAGKNNNPGYSGDGGAATNAQFHVIRDISVTANGGYLVVDQENYRIRRVSPKGVISTAAGTGTPGYSSRDDGKRATEVELGIAWAVAAYPDGSFVFAEANPYMNDPTKGEVARIRRVSASGFIRTLKGFADWGKTQLWAPTALSYEKGGSLLVADRGQRQVFRWKKNNVTVVAGGGTGVPEEGALASEARFFDLSGVAATTDGGFLLADYPTHRIYQVTPKRLYSYGCGEGCRVRQ